MKNLWLVVAILLMSSTAFAEENFESKIRLQGTTSDKGFGLSGVMEISNIDSPQTFAGLGVSHTNSSHELALHLGTVSTVNANNVDYHYLWAAAVDVRGTVNLNDKIFTWFNINITNLNDTNRLRGKVFAMVDYKLPDMFKNVALGLETDNLLNLGLDSSVSGPNTMSIGPNALLMFTPKVRMEFAYQAHSQVNNQIWARLNARF